VLFAAEDFFRWQPHPEVWILVLGVAGLYWWALRSIGPKVVPAGVPAATRSQKRWFVIGIVLLWLASDWPMHDIGEQYLYSLHMVQHMLYAFFIPPVMLMATPEWLARLIIGDGPVGRWFLKLARPVPGAVIFNAVQLLTHWSVVVNGSVENGLLHYALHAIVIVTAFAVWMPVVSPLPELRTTVPAQCVHLFLISIVPTVPAAWLALADGVLYDAYDHSARLWGLSVTHDQQFAGLIMKLGGSAFLWTVIIVLFFRWVRREDHGTTPRRVVVGADGEVLSVEGPAALTYDDVARAFEQAPAPKEPAG
jgi:putative membrane protein